MDNQEEKFVAPGYDENLHTCDQCTDTGISLEDFDYCKSCRMGPRIKQLDAFAQQLQLHDFTSAMRIVFRSTMRTEKALAAADKALLTVKCREQAAKIAELEAKQAWQPIETAPRDRIIMLGRAKQSGEVYAISIPGRWIEGYPDSVDEMGHDSGFMDLQYDCFTCPRTFGAEAYRTHGIQPTHWQPLPDAPQSPVDSKLEDSNG